MPSKYASKLVPMSSISSKKLAVVSIPKRKRRKRVPAAISIIKSSIGNSNAVGLPETLKIKLAYQYLPQLLSGTSGVYSASKSWAINNLYDVDPAIGGVQPPLYDNLTAIYRRWRVTKVKFTFDYTSGTGNTQRVYLAYTGEDQTDLSNMLNYNLYAGPNTKSKLVGGTSNGKAYGSISATYDLKKLVGSELEDGNYYGGIVSPYAPATLLYAQVGVMDMTYNATSCYLSVTPRVEFWCEFNDLNAEAYLND